MTLTVIMKQTFKLLWASHIRVYLCAEIKRYESLK